MNEYANYVRVYEGYPEFMIDMKTVNPNSQLKNFKFTPWSLPINLLDFYQSLNCINKFYAIIRNAFTELVEVLKPHD